MWVPVVAWPVVAGQKSQLVPLLLLHREPALVSLVGGVLPSSSLPIVLCRPSRLSQQLVGTVSVVATGMPIHLDPPHICPMHLRRSAPPFVQEDEGRD
jgi:hypothetical protein